MAAAAQQQALASLKGLLESGAYSDLTISCNGDTYKVHKNIVCDKIDFFTRAIRFGGKRRNLRMIQPLLHTKIYEIADKYEVKGLKDLAREKFKRSCEQFWDNDVFAVAAHHVFSTTPDSDKGLRDLVSLTISKHMCLMDKPEIEALLTEFNGLAFGLLKLTRKTG
ncbi:uncharacterized protein J4E88_010738 [Alternaria novae-zelandiae]|uniref:uncharacterized protein n=1 Tax=Alternaria novae-zelandiae TaxID=430562 RepID=UPI0020C32A18|nr:uncharacterized protein J4E88_010738 [Alternaria novae-zelandiae]KAI4664486.1 hypothetical protein J4E88_010738 [Alternaria novae-zelandiae]